MVGAAVDELKHYRNCIDEEVLQECLDRLLRAFMAIKDSPDEPYYGALSHTARARQFILSTLSRQSIEDAARSKRSFFVDVRAQREALDPMNIPGSTGGTDAGGRTPGCKNFGVIGSRFGNTARRIHFSTRARLSRIVRMLSLAVFPAS